MVQRLIEYPSSEEMSEALKAMNDVLSGCLDKAKVDLYSYASTLLLVKKILFVDWTKFTILVEE